MKKLPQGLDAWLVWIDYLRTWLRSMPTGLDPTEWHEVKDVSYEDLTLLADHFETERRPEDYNHRQSVEIDLDKDNTLVFYSKPRRFTYLDQ